MRKRNSLQRWEKEQLTKMGKVHRRRRINTEEKAKVFAAVWGAEFIQFLAA